MVRKGSSRARFRESVGRLRDQWRRQGHQLDFGIGITSGYATLGAIGFEGRWDYGAIGSVVNLSKRLCDEAPGGHILISQRFLSIVEELVETEFFGELSLKGFPHPVTTHNIVTLKD